MPIKFSSVFPLFSEVYRTVFGTVLGSTGAVPASLTVTVKQEALDGTLTTIGTAETDADTGAYKFSYDPETNKPVILRVSLESIEGTPTEIIVSPGFDERVDFKLGTVAGTSRVPRYTDVAARVDAVLAPNSVDIADLDGLGVARLALASGVHPKEAALAREAKVSSTLANQPRGLFYGLARGGLSAAVADLAKHPASDRERALDRAIADGTLSPEDAAEALDALEDLNDVMIASALETPTSVATPGLALDLAGVTNPGIREGVLQLWANHTGSVDAFWAAADSLTSTEKADAQFALQLDQLTRANAPLISHLFETYDSAEELAELTLTQWETLVGTNPAPQFLADAGVDASTYAKAMFKAVEDAFPTPMLGARSTDFTGASAALASFVANNASFLEPDNKPYDLAGLPLREFLRLNPGAIQAAGDQAAQDALKAELPILERLYRISPRGARFEVMKELRAAGVASATQIQLMGRARFMAALGPALGEHADSVYRRARALSSAALMLHLRHRTSSPTGAMAVLPVVSDDPLSGTTSPVTWAELFGGRSFCACSECQSAHGPAAYLADLLFWLRSRDTDGGFLDALLGRRPDLGTLELSCKNTNTPLPTIDLVLEQLEGLLAPEGVTPRQTTLEADELAARAEHVNASAYARLSGASDHAIFYPFDQPYVAALDQARTFIKTLGVDRSVAMMTLLGGGPATALDPEKLEDILGSPDAGALGSAEMAAEILGMTRTSWDILAGDRTATTAVRWGLQREFFRLTSVWSVDESTTAGPGADDPFGGKNAVNLTDASGAAATAWTIESSSYSGGALTGSIYVKKITNPGHFAEIRLGISGDYSVAGRTFALNLGDGETSGGASLSIPNFVPEEPTGWWKVEFSLADPGGPPTSVGLRVVPAAGSSFPTGSAAAQGTTTIYAPRVAADGDTDELTKVASATEPSFLTQAGDRAAEAPLTYAELEDLLSSQYVQDTGASGQLNILFDNDTCDVTGAVLEPIAEATFEGHLDRLSKLIRLHRDLGWSVRDVDRAIVTFRTSASGRLEESDVNESLLMDLAGVRWLERALDRSPDEILTFFAPLDTRRWRERLKWDPSEDRRRIPNPNHANDGGAEAEPSPFQRLTRLLPDASVFAVTNTGSDLAVTSEPLADHLGSVAAIAGVEPRELDALIASIPPALDPQPRLTLHSITQIYRRVSLARALGISTAELLEWGLRLGAAWLPIDWEDLDEPLASPLEVVQFVAEVKRNATVRLSTEALDELIGERNERDLAKLGLPDAGVALLALAEEARAHSPAGSAFDPSAVDGANLLPAPGALVWTAVDGATITGAQVDPAGAANGALLGDASGAASASAQATAGGYSTGTAVWGSVWIKQVAAPTAFAKIGVVFGATTPATFGLDLQTGETKVLSGAFELIDVLDAGDWWFVAFRHAGAAETTAGLRVWPAAGAVPFVEGVAATGSVTAYGARIAAAAAEAADPRAPLALAEPLYPYAERDRAVLRRAATLLNLDAGLASDLFEKLRYEGTDQGVPARLKLLDAALTVAEERAADPVGSADPEALTAYDRDVWELVAIGGWIARAFTLRVDDLPWLLDSPAGGRGFDVEDIIFGASRDARYSAWAKLREAGRLRQVAPDGGLYALFAEWTSGAPNAAAVRGALAEVTRWSEVDLLAAIPDLFVGGPVGGSSAADLAEPERFSRLAGWLELARALNVPAASLLGWSSLVWAGAGGAPEPVATYEAHAREIEDALRASWGAERWLVEMPTIREGLRNRQRHALLSRIVGDRFFTDDLNSSDVVGQRILMDVQMGACARTSRLKDALRTVQAFVARVLLGQEEGLQLEPAEADEWAWRKNFRVWEANRKVFLYPENWLRPELRRDKTPFFAQLEADLASGDLRDDLVEEAYRGYLRQLALVSKLEALAILREDRGAGAPVHHVFARTRAIPYSYFHRELVDGNRWTPWREVPRVEGEHLLPVVYQRRLMLFWLNVSDSAVEPAEHTVASSTETDAEAPPATTTTTPSATRYFSIRLSWSEYRDGRWAGATKGPQAIGVDERGQVTPEGFDPIDLVSCGVEAESTTGERKTFPASVLHANVSVESGGRDLLVSLFREREDHTSHALPRFRVSAIDGQVTIEKGDRAADHAAPPVEFVDYVTRAQRFVREYDQRFGDLPPPLALPLPHASASSPTYVALLTDADDFTRDASLRITPVSVTHFDSTAPFVFEERAGTYWATYKPTRFFGPIGFGGSYWPGGDRDLPLVPPTVSPGSIGTSIALSDESKRVFRSKHTGGTDALLDSASVSLAIGGGSQIVAINASKVDKAAKKFTLNASFQIADDTGATVLGPLRAASMLDREDVVQVVRTFEIPAVSVGATMTTEGFHFLAPAHARWRFDTFFHPHVGLMRETLNRLGVFGLIDPPSVTPAEPLAGQNPTPETTLSDRYTLAGVNPVPPDDLDFSATGAYAQYNWELFFHAPFLIASRLHEAGKFEEALKWLRTIFDPFRPAQAGEEADETARAFWRFRPFREQFAADEGATLPRNIQEVVALLTASSSDDAAVALATDLLQQIADWRRNPFDPHAIARTRVITYMTAVVMKYLEVLIDWGDELFARDTLESIGEASEYYLLAARILGPRPEEIEIRDPEPVTFNTLVERFVSGEGSAERLEEALAVETWEIPDEELADDANSLASLLYFCVPANPELRPRFWDRVADRLFKIRNCMDIQGRRRELALFEPPIDPDLLVRAAAAGADLRSMLAEVVSGHVPHRRYLAMADLAAGLAAGAQGLGQALLGATEKRDADQLATLRNQHERRLQEDAIRARRDQITDIEHQLQALRHGRAATARRLAYYKDKPRTSSREAQQLRKAQDSRVLLDVAGGYATAATVLGLIPELDIGSAGAGGSPKVTAAFGGRALAAVANAYARGLETAAGVLEREGRMLLAESGYDRRQEEWRLQADLAKNDLDATDERLLSMEIQLALARSALATAELRMEQIDEVQDVLERRFAREDLYDWLQSELSRLHYQSYQLAYEFAKKAEKAWQYELGRNDTFIQFGYWDSGRKGLLAADKLGHDLRRMQVAYTELSTRRLEVEQTFSLREIDPVALVRLQLGGTTELALPEAFYDLYYPGHYGRRIRAVRLTIPAVVPPNTNVPAHLDLLQHWIRKTPPAVGDGIPDAGLSEGGYGAAPVTMTATSSGQRDGGVFELDFRGPRLLPFEGAGAVSKWRITLPKRVRSFAYSEIQDVLVHVAYDAEYSGTLRGVLEPAAGTPAPAYERLFQAKAWAEPRRRIISLRREHGSALRRLVQAGAQATPPSPPFPVSFAISEDVLPAYVRAGEFSLTDPKIALITGETNLGGFSIAINGIPEEGDPPPPPPVTWDTWDEVAAEGADGPPMLDVDGAFPDAQGGLVRTHTLAVTAWGTNRGFLQAPDFDILIVVTLESP